MAAALAAGQEKDCGACAAYGDVVCGKLPDNSMRRSFSNDCQREVYNCVHNTSESTPLGQQDIVDIILRFPPQ
jgi:hypothetical protein